MAQLDPQARTALGRYWSEILAGAAAHLTTADLFSNIRDRAAELGYSSVGVGASTVSVLRGIAGRMISASDRLNAADPSLALSAAHIAEAPWSRPLAEQNTMPVHNVSFQHTIQLDDGSTVTKYQTITITGVLPDTVGDLQNLIASEAALMAAEGGAADSGTPHGTSLGTDSLMITAV